MASSIWPVTRDSAWLQGDSKGRRAESRVGRAAACNNNGNTTVIYCVSIGHQEEEQQQQIDLRRRYHAMQICMGRACAQTESESTQTHRQTAQTGRKKWQLDGEPSRDSGNLTNG